MPNIVTYTQKELPQPAGAVFQPYKEAPPMTPIGIADAETAAKVKLGHIIADIGEYALRAIDHNEIITANAMFNQFEIDWDKKIQQKMTENRGTNAIKPEFIKNIESDLNTDIQTIVSESELSQKNKDALTKVLRHKAATKIGQAASFQRQEQAKVENTNIEFDYQQRLNNITLGADWQQQAEEHKKVININQPGYVALGLLHEARFEAHALTVERETFHKAIYDKLRAGAIDSKGNIDYDEAIATLLNANFQRENNITTKVKDQIFNELKAEKAYVQSVNTEAANRQYNTELNDISTKQIKGDVRGAVNAVMESTHIPAVDKVQILKSIQTPPPEGKSNSSAYLEGIEKMYDPEISIEDKKIWLLSNRGKLNITDFKHLSNTGMSQERTNDKAAIVAGSKIITKALIDPKYKSRTQSDRAQEAVDLYVKGIAENPELNTPTKKTEYAHEILRMPKFNSVNIIEDRMTDVQNLQKKVTGQGIPTPGKKVVGYKDGKPVYDMGNNIWQVGD